VTRKIPMHMEICHNSLAVEDRKLKQANKMLRNVWQAGVRYIYIYIYI